LRGAILDDAEVLERVDDSNLAEAFHRSDILSDEEVVLSCLRSPSPQLLSGMLMALAIAELPPSPDVMDEILQIRDSSADAGLRGNARQVYARWHDGDGLRPEPFTSKGW
jgi:hypothetical protein